MAGNFKRRALASALMLALALDAQASSGNDQVRRIDAVPGPEEIGAARDPSLLVLTSGIFDPTRERLSHPLAPRVTERGRYAIVQFHAGAPMDADWLAGMGAKVLGFVPNRAYLVDVDPAARAELVASGKVRHVSDWLPDYKLAPGLLDNAPDELEFELLLFRGADAGALTTVLPELRDATRSVRVNERAQPAWRVRVGRDEAPAFLARVAAIDSVQWIERYEMPQLFNSNSVWPIQNNSVAGANPIGNAPIWMRDILGTGQIVAVADSGLDRNEDWFRSFNDGVTLDQQYTDAVAVTPPSIGAVHPQRKVYGYFVMPGATGYDTTATCPGGTPVGFHGTHVVGTVLGDAGVASTPTDANHQTGDGMAPNAQVLFQDIGHDTTGCLSGQGGLPMFEQAKAAGAFIHSNSYGSAFVNAPFYTGGDAAVDQALWNNEDQIIVFAAGNEGPGATSIGHPAHSKNATTVGALGNGNSVTIAGFSSRGPTSDGRRKPDIVAPGSSIVSAAGNSNNVIPSPSAGAPVTSSKSGTSMATPTIAGGTALMRQYFTDGFYPSGTRTAADERAPLGTELRAALLNGTAFLSTTPGNNTGWGRVWLDNNLYFNGDTRRLRTFSREHDAGLATSDQHEYRVQVGAGQEFRATLVWHDPAGSPGAAGRALVNDLDLEVLDGASTLYRGNVFGTAGTGSVSQTGGVADTLNPVEQVRFTAPTAGTYTVRVRGRDVPGNGQSYSARQGYALAVSHAQCASAAVTAPASVGAANAGGAVEVTAAPVAGATGYQLYRADGTCAAADASAFQLVAHGNSNLLLDDHTEGGYSYAYKVRGVDACGEGPISSCTEVVSGASCELFPSFDQSSLTAVAATPGECSTRLQWSAGSSSCPSAPGLRYNVYRSTDPLFVPDDANRIASDVSTTEYVDATAASLTTYYYVVRAEDETTGNDGPNGGNESIGSQRLRHTPTGIGSVPGTFFDGADSPSFLVAQTPWSTTNARAFGGSYSYRNALHGAGSYDADTCAEIRTPPITLQAGSPVLSFRARYNVEVNWDGVVMEISTNGGASWSDLPPDGGYPSNFSQTGNPPLNGCGYPASQGAFGGSSGGNFSAFTRALTAFAGQTVQLRWRFSSDPGSEEEGFYLDDVQVTNASTPAACTVGTPTFTVTPSASAGGSIAPSVPQTIDQNTTTSFTLDPDANFRIGSVGGTCGGSLTGNSFTTAPVVADCSVEANFVPKIATSTVLDATPNPTRANQPVAFGVIVSGTGSAPPDGAVQVDASTGESCSDAGPPQISGNDALFECDISFASYGPRTATAQFAGSDQYLDSSSSPVEVSVVRMADVSVSIDDGSDEVEPGQTVDYLVQLRNAGPDDAPSTQLSLVSAPELGDAAWTCTPVGAATCPASSGSGEVSATVDLGVGTGLDYVQSGTAAAALSEGLATGVIATVDADAPNFVLDPDPADNADDDVDLTPAIFADGFEN